MFMAITLSDTPRGYASVHVDEHERELVTSTLALAGATGRFRSLAFVLLERGHQVRVVTREPEAATARELARAGAAVVRGDFDDPASLIAAARGADAFFAAGTAHRVGADGERQHGINVAEAARES